MKISPVSYISLLEQWGDDYFESLVIPRLLLLEVEEEEEEEVEGVLNSGILKRRQEYFVK